MKKEYIEVLELTKASIAGTKVELNSELEWTELCKLLKVGKLYSVVYHTILKSKDELQVPEKLLAEWKANTFSLGFCQLRMISELKYVLREAESRGIQLVLFKGVTLAALYPEPYMRSSNDVDLLVSEEQRNAAERLLVELGFKKREEISKAHVPVYVVDDGSRYLKIELHDRLWEDYEGKQADILREMQLDNPQTLIEQEACGLTVTTLGHTEHLIYQIFHIAKHFFFEGISLRYLVDIMLFIESYKEAIDFARVRKEITKLHYERFYEAILKICYEYLGMKVVIPDINVESIEVNEQLLKDILERGKLDGAVKKWETINFLSQYFMRTSVTKSSNFQQRRKQIFPFPSELNDRYSYAKKCPLLLPVAWIHRVIYMISYSYHCKKNDMKTSETIGKAQYRLDLMRNLGMTETDKDVQELLSEKGE